MIVVDQAPYRVHRGAEIERSPPFRMPRGGDTPPGVFSVDVPPGRWQDAVGNLEVKGTKQ